jgi:hypothetical protein
MGNFGCEICGKKEYKLQEKIEDSICTIKNNRGLYTLGFFCIIKRPKIMRVLITNDDINWKKIADKKIIILYINNKQNELKIEKSKKFYINKKNNIK